MDLVWLKHRSCTAGLHSTSLGLVDNFVYLHHFSYMCCLSAEQMMKYVTNRAISFKLKISLLLFVDILNIQLVMFA